MMKIVECVPNISEGRNPDIYNAVARSSEKISGIKLLDVDPGAATNRTVITFAGPPELMVNAAFEVIKLSKELIDMRCHKGEHPRMGATDVCPFVPVAGVSMEECAELARQLGKRLGEELGVWVYLYEYAASKPQWKKLADIRQGEYESLAGRVGDTKWEPDFGPKELDPKFGAMAVGAREFLVAYNINMNSLNKRLAKDISYNIRESGRTKRESYPDGPIVRNDNGKQIMVPGKFKNCASTAWIIPEYNCAQITMNLTDIEQTPVHLVFDEVVEQAHQRGMRVTGSEIVGLVPLKTMLDAGKYFLQKQEMSAAVSQKELVQTAIKSLGLNDVSPFRPEDKIVEYRFKRTGRLVDQRIDEFADTLASDAPAPGGGSVAALCGNLAAALMAMVTNLTYGKKEHQEKWQAMEKIGLQGQDLKDWFLAAIDRDTDAFNVVMNAMGMPKKTSQEKATRNQAMIEANKVATRVPLGVMERALEIAPLLEEVANNGNPNCMSDIGVAAYCMLTCAEGAALNVRINLAGIDDQSFKNECLSKIEKTMAEIRKRGQQIISIVDKNL